MGVGSEDTSGMDRRAPICPPPQAFIFLGKDPSLEILQQEGGTLAHWSGQGICRSCPQTSGAEPWLAMALCLKQVFAKDKTFRPRKRFEPGTQRFELYKKAQASLKSGLDLRSVVRLPPGENIDDWIAVHVVDFFNRINLIYGTMAERCSESSCPVMAGGPRYEYRWQDERQYRRPAKLSAPRYMALLMDWIEGLINDEEVFPTRVDWLSYPLPHQAKGARDPAQGLAHRWNVLEFPSPRTSSRSAPRS
ncbi:MOB kinase activator 3C isoform X2 [Camelus ferus]|uniref:MOB kinase activator 3C isoform X2 n=2 Tax=Camelus TaxID=9836 RepID=A0A8B7K660_CAMFR|nr:MOB kinase activator 3C isoform X2 [Camelus ferus]